MEQALGAALLVRPRQASRRRKPASLYCNTRARILRQVERLREDLGAYAGGLAGQIRVLSTPMRSPNSCRRR